ncbi:unnamed protein product [Closterium sp. NIES-54]
MRRCSGSGALVPLFAILPRTSSTPALFPASSLAFPHDAPGWQFYHPTLRRVLPSPDVMFDELVPFYHLFPYRTAPLPPPPAALPRSGSPSSRPPSPSGSCSLSRTRSSAPAPLPPLHGDGGERV